MESMDPEKYYLSKLAQKANKARNEKLSPERRREIALKAIAARWAKNKQKKENEK